MKRLFIISLILFSSNFSFSQNSLYSAIGFYNLENLFDTIDAPDIMDEEFTPDGKKLWNSEKYYKKLENLSSVISDLATDKVKDGVAILGIVEIENRNVVEDLINMPKLKSRNYQIIHFESNDHRGIDIGILYQSKYFTPEFAEPVPVDIYNGDEKIFTRDILYVRGTYLGEKMNILVNHWPSRAGGEAKTAPWRAAAASKCREIIDSISIIYPNSNFIVMGDLNDDPTNPSIRKYLYSTGNLKKIKDSELYNPFESFYDKGIGTTAYRDAWSLFDQIIINQNLTDKKGLDFYKAYVFNKDYLIQKKGDYKGYPLRTFVGNEFLNGYSDHFPVYIYLKNNN
ncbi:MAG: endonuclease/exonuclease/phosphatase family protein [Saprospiraceae bacterium]